MEIVLYHPKVISAAFVLIRATFLFGGDGVDIFDVSRKMMRLEIQDMAVSGKEWNQRYLVML